MLSILILETTHSSSISHSVFSAALHRSGIKPLSYAWWLPAQQHIPSVAAFYFLTPPAALRVTLPLKLQEAGESCDFKCHRLLPMEVKIYPSFGPFSSASSGLLVASRKRKLGHRHTQKEDHVKTWREDVHL
ncbi:COX assembly mitochondrial protein 2 homolog isoform X2 [Pteropus medius]|uniref:COX assembly mitochondrial protein 2 homolog isoform X2 n=1 Tax=Pteropus vampyrus TaxID=132908 RepID=UPI00196AEC68|nr:COX assembly mitochondrial protein 2 homolog isoform X2 [Pteropus giganteus]